MSKQAARQMAQTIADRYTKGAVLGNAHLAATALAQYERLVARLGYDPLA